VKSEIYNLIHKLQVGVSVKMNIKSGREGKQINQENKVDDTVICLPRFGSKEPSPR
jgi:hypothetical protein